jgi:ribose/xylose/arabinose/galactoside ABC-type transport system permease subunit
VLALLIAGVLRYTVFAGTFAIGSNERTARLCGVRGAGQGLVYTLSAAPAGVAGVMQFAKFPWATPR